KAVSKDDLDPAVLEKEREIVTEQTKTVNAGKPDNIIAKIVEGRLKTFLSENCLVDQVFVMDSSKTVGQAAQEAGISIKKMYHWILGK
ncbi:MAG: translation elongation factor Ts, partial [Planctomycetia bacterium]|nr:translation elongation factor Ts [Planctomycetia bacterium]